MFQHGLIHTLIMSSAAGREWDDTEQVRKQDQKKVIKLSTIDAGLSVRECKGKVRSVGVFSPRWHTWRRVVTLPSRLLDAKLYDHTCTGNCSKEQREELKHKILTCFLTNC